MNEQSTTQQHPLNSGDGLLEHVIAAVAGILLMISGVGMGVTVVLLPLGIPVGLAGLGIFLWGLFGRRQEPMVENKFSDAQVSSPGDAGTSKGAGRETP